MRLLIDTNILIRAIHRPTAIPSRWRDALTAEAADVSFSIVSIWEVAIKASFRRDDFMVDPDRLNGLALAQGFGLVSPTLDAVLAVKDMPLHHRDPFDRILIAQARTLEADFLTGDRGLAAYGPPVVVL